MDNYYRRNRSGGYIPVLAGGAEIQYDMRVDRQTNPFVLCRVEWEEKEESSDTMKQP